MIVWCGRCNTNPVDLAAAEPAAVTWFGHRAKRPWCTPCIRYAILRWPDSIVPQPPGRRCVAAVAANVWVTRHDIA